LPDGTGTHLHPGTGLRKVVSDWIGGGDLKKTVITTYGSIEDWQVSGVTSLQSVFDTKNTFNADLSKWNVAAVTNMQATFSSASAFNGDLSKWNVAAVTNMQAMFAHSGFKRTLCGSKWLTLGQVVQNYWGPVNARLGCCPIGKYMSNPDAVNFVTSTSCDTCPSGTYFTNGDNDDTSCPPASCDGSSIAHANAVRTDGTATGGTGQAGTTEDDASTIIFTCNQMLQDNAYTTTYTCGDGTFTESTLVTCPNYCGAGTSWADYQTNYVNASNATALKLAYDQLELC